LSEERDEREGGKEGEPGGRLRRHAAPSLQAVRRLTDDAATCRLTALFMAGT
jgi:hypothetical protein